ncbi:interferon-induced helicase C domain-containing protein 1-like [Mercenaria mercenaria]|uniref:interferon-induced helicase C domain-containing protein 1-like n=1 Tax=Mercenaria mercenaria TaxID=6596 RepID=UPI00234EF1B3|nr:interferon-induced helicase C domain-containing protein 1-like [Mercenaria mercenaria]XP_053386488.1 interferon-induced helicase C domain-containing protein 1-like [Mercenaria mercenaria]
MTEVYMPYIKYQIKVIDIIDGLHFLNKRDVEVILSIHNFCASDAFELLINSIKKSDSRGKWQAFIDALEDYEHIKLLLENKTELHHQQNSELLKLVAPNLEKRMKLPEFLDTAYEKELLTEEDRTKVEAKLKNYGEHAAARVIIENIDKHKRNWNTVLIEILQQHQFCLSDIADLFKMIEQKEPDVTTEGATVLYKRTKSKEEMEWRLQHLRDKRSDFYPDGEKQERKRTMSHEQSSSRQKTQPQAQVIQADWNNEVTRQDILSLTLEIRKLRKLLKRDTLIKPGVDK